MTNSESCTVWLPIEFHGFPSRMNSKGYHSLVPGLIPIFFRDCMGPFKNVFIQSDKFTYGISASNYVLNLRYRPHYAKYKDLYWVLHTTKSLNRDNIKKFAY